MEIIIVLGCVDANIRTLRVDRAVQKFFDSNAENYCSYINDDVIQTYILLSGGSVNKNETESEADLMYKYITQFVDKKYVDLENKSRNSIENLINCKEKIDRIFKNSEKPIITICTSTFHINRVIVLSKLIFNGYTTQFIHTNEIVSNSFVKHEEKLLMQNIKWYCKNQLQI